MNGPSQVDRATSVDARGSLIVNADDWGRDRDVTDRTYECVAAGSVSSVSAMVFMEDSERAAEIARERNVDTGLHLNLTTPFSGTGMSSRLQEQQGRVTKHLRRHRLAPAIYHPGVAKAFEYVVKSQLEEYEKRYGKPAERVDGHHHMHLSANVLYAGLLPRGIMVRRNFSFGAADKGFANRMYRRFVDKRIASQYRITDFFYSLPPMDVPGRLEKIFALGREHRVEVETHPINRDEHKFLTDGSIFRIADGVPIAGRYFVPAGNESER